MRLAVLIAATFLFVLSVGAYAQTYEFSIRGPDIIVGTVGKVTVLKIDVLNNGTAQDKYNVIFVASSPNLVNITGAVQTTENILPNTVTGISARVMPLIESTNIVTVTVNSLNCGSCLPKTLDIPLRSSFYSLPEFGFSGFLQIIILSTIAYFLVNRTLK